MRQRLILAIVALCKVVLAVAMLACAIGFVGRRFVFPTFRIDRAMPRPSSGLAETVTADDGVAVHILRWEAAPDRPMVVHFHTNRQTVADAIPFAEALFRRGLGVVLVEYRGYGPTDDAQPSEQGVYADAEAVLRHIRAGGHDVRHIVLSGASLGTGVAAEMARRGHGAALLLASPFTSIVDLVHGAVPFAPGWLVADRFDTLSKARSIRVPTLVIHGDRDPIVPFSMGQRLASVIAESRLLRVHGGHHGDLFERDGAHLYAEIAAWAHASCD